MKHQFETHKVDQAQGIASMCLVCGKDNPSSLKGQFLVLDDDKVMGIFEPNELLQSYPDRLHGGISAAILDETLGRVLLHKEPEMQAVTMELNLKYRKPVPLDKKIVAIAELTKSRSRTYDAAGKIVLDDGEVAVEATGRYVKLKTEDVGIPDNATILYDDVRDYPDEVEI